MSKIRKVTVLIEYPDKRTEECLFEVTDDSSDVLFVACPICGNEIELVYGKNCANGHIAYTIIDGEDIN